MWNQIIPTLTDVEHVFFWALLLTAISVILLFTYCLCEAAGREPLAQLAEDEPRRQELQRVFPKHFGVKR